MPFFNFLRRKGKKGSNTVVQPFVAPAEDEKPMTAPANQGRPDCNINNEADARRAEAAVTPRPATVNDEVAPSRVISGADESPIENGPQSPRSPGLPGSQEPPAACEEESMFELPLALVHMRVGEAFGQMIASSLQATKWDKRAQALKAVGTVLKGLDLEGMAKPGDTGALGRGLRLRDRANCWRTSVQLLHHAMRDKVIPVQLAAHVLFLDTFAHAEAIVEPEEAKQAASLLVGHAIARLGDSNLRLHESAQKCVVVCAERPGLLGLRNVLERLDKTVQAAAKGRDRAKVAFGVLSAVQALIKQFPGQRDGAGVGQPEEDEDDLGCDAAPAGGESWSQEDVMPFIATGMDDSLGPRVRPIGVALAVHMHQTFGLEAITPFLSTLRPAVQTHLRQKFKEAEEDMAGDEVDDDGDDAGVEMPDLCIEGTAVRSAASGGRFAPLPGAMGCDDDEEMLMDGILEDAGEVFQGSSALMGEGSAGFARRASPPNFGRPDLDGFEEDLQGLERSLELDGCSLSARQGRHQRVLPPLEVC